MACDDCLKWFHPNCTGLTATQYAAMDNHGAVFHCAACSHKTQKPKGRTQDAATSTEEAPSAVLSVPAKVEESLAILAAKMEKLENMLLKIQAIGDKNTAEITAEIAQVKAVLPAFQNADATNRIVSQEVIDATSSLRDQMARERRVILWGSFPKDTDPTKTAQSVLSGVVPSPQTNKIMGQWLRAKQSKAVKGILACLPDKETALQVIATRVEIRQRFGHIKGISLDRPLADRQKRESPDKSEKPQDKLLLSPKVVFTPLSEATGGIETQENGTPTIVPDGSPTPIDGNLPSSEDDMARSTPKTGATVIHTSEASTSPPATVQPTPDAAPIIPSFKRGRTGLLGHPKTWSSLFNNPGLKTPIKSHGGQAVNVRHAANPVAAKTDHKTEPAKQSKPPKPKSKPQKPKPKPPKPHSPSPGQAPLNVQKTLKNLNPKRAPDFQLRKPKGRPPAKKDTKPQTTSKRTANRKPLPSAQVRQAQPKPLKPGPVVSIPPNRKPNWRPPRSQLPARPPPNNQKPFYNQNFSLLDLIALLSAPLPSTQPSKLQETGRKTPKSSARLR